MSTNKLITVKEVSETILGIDSGTTWKYIREGIIPPGVVVRIGRRIWINERKFWEWLENGGSISSQQS